MKYTTAGESHGRGLVAIVTGVPAGVPLTAEEIDRDLVRRQKGYGRGGRMAIEADRALLLAGVRHGRTIGSPVAITIANQDWENWTDVMSPVGERRPEAAVTAPRPGHADLAGVQKTGTDDVRDVLERASARETAARVAAGGVAKCLLHALGVLVASYVTRIGEAALEPEPQPDGVDLAAVLASDVACPDPQVGDAMRAAIDAARDAGESLGGTFVVFAAGVVSGIGGYGTVEERLDARLAAALASVPAVKGVEFGLGFRAAALPGSRVHDEIAYGPGRGFHRTTNRAGGLEGGMTNGETVVARAAMKPIPTLAKPLRSVDLRTKEAVDASRERSDVCAVPAAAVVAEAEVALVLADAYTRKFGGDSLGDLLVALEAYRRRIEV